MMRYVIVAILSVFVLSCSGVKNTSVGSEQIAPENVDKIITGKTTKDEIMTLFGQPISEVKMNASGDTWTYLNAKSREEAGFLTSKIELSTYGLTVTFDENNIVKDCLYTTADPVKSSEKPKE